jgi:two-component system phosphate regulon sensor histidine kinase PhoR
VPRDLGQLPKVTVRAVFRSTFLWKVLGATAVTVVIAIVTVAAVILVRSPVLKIEQAYELGASLAVATLSGLVVAVCVGFLLTRSVHKALTELTRVAESLACGDFSARVKRLGQDEFGLLGLTLNLLGEELTDRMAALSQERTQLAALFGGMVEGIVAVGDDDRILFANGAADRLLRTGASLARGKQMSEVPGLGLLLPVVIQCRTEKKRKHTELKLRDADHLVELETHASPFKGEQTAGVVVVLHDVTELRRLERVRRDFVANVSHELKTPLTSIKGYVETLQSGAKSDPVTLDRFLERIEVNIARLVELVQDILSLAKIENQEGKWSKTAIDLGSVVRQSLVQHEMAVASKQIVLNVQVADNVFVQGDREALRQVMDNLLINAIKYTPSGGQVRLRVERDNDVARLSIEDTGVGIPPEHHSRIFERFYRVDKHRSREDGGTGLGLSIVKNLVSAMNGKVFVSSEPGRGSCFTVQMRLNP